MEQQERERIEGIEGLVGRTPHAYLATLDRDGAPRVKVVTVFRREGWSRFWFVTQTGRRTTGEIEADSRASLYFADNVAFETLLLTGHAEVSRDPAILRTLWQEGLRSMFPGGVDDPNFSAIAFTATGGKYYRWPCNGEFALEGQEPQWLNWVRME